MITIRKLNNKILKVCPKKEAESIIQHCKLHEFNKARIIIEGLEEEVEKRITANDRDNYLPEEYEQGEQTDVDRFIAYQGIWNEIVNHLENSYA